MDRLPKYVAQIENIYFVSRIGISLRHATVGITHEELAEHLGHLLRLSEIKESGKQSK
jgi:hypothetical protein